VSLCTKTAINSSIFPCHFCPRTCGPQEYIVSLLLYNMWRAQNRNITFLHSQDTKLYENCFVTIGSWWRSFCAREWRRRNKISRIDQSWKFLNHYLYCFTEIAAVPQSTSCFNLSSHTHTHKKTLIVRLWVHVLYTHVGVCVFGGVFVHNKQVCRLQYSVCIVYILCLSIYIETYDKTHWIISCSWWLCTNKLSMTWMFAARFMYSILCIEYEHRVLRDWVSTLMK